MTFDEFYQEYLPYLEALKRRPASARMYLNASQSVSATTDTIVNLDAETFSSEVKADTANHTFKVATEGYYLLAGQVLYNDPETDKYLTVSLHVNGSASQSSYASLITNGTNIQGTRIQDVLHLVPGDTVEMHTYHNCTGSEGLKTGSAYTFLTIYKLK